MQSGAHANSCEIRLHAGKIMDTSAEASVNICSISYLNEACVTNKYRDVFLIIELSSVWTCEFI